MEAEVTPEVTPEPTPQPQPAPEPTPEPILEDEGKEPGGDDPQAVRARKEYRARKAAQAEAERQREENIRLQARLEAIEEERKRTPAAAEKIYTVAELDAAVEAGTITANDRRRYVDEILKPRERQALLDEVEVRLAEKTRLAKVRQEIGDHLKYNPDLGDRTSVAFRKVAEEYRRLVEDRGFPDNEATRLEAVERVDGTLETLRKKHELAELNANPRTIPSDPGGGGGIKSNGKVDISKAPAHLVSFWERTGTSKEDREKEMAYWVKNQTRTSSVSK